MSQKYTLSAELRDLTVKNQLYRQQGKTLANVYGEGESRALTLPIKESLKLLAEVSESTVFYLNIESVKEALPVMIGEIQRDPVSGQVLHLSLRQVNLKEKVTAPIEVITTGEFNVPDAVFILVHHEIEAEALPTDLPESFVIDLSKFKAIGDQFSFADLEYDRQKITLQIDNENDPIAVVNEVEEEVVQEVVAPEAAEAETPAGESGDKGESEGGSGGEKETKSDS